MQKVSVIIPIYNTFNYIPECLDSIINQTYTNLEIILVNDGSTDKSLDLCYEYASKDKRIIVINKSNEGLSSARNTGLDIATGEFISFVDSDDVLSIDTLRDNIKYLNEYPSVAILQFPMIYDWLSSKERQRNLKFELIKSEDVFINLWDDNKINGSCCCKIFKAKIKDKLRFTKGYYFEDSLMHYHLLEKQINDIIISDKGCYFYRNTVGSITHQEWSAKKWGDYLEVFLLYYNKALALGLKKEKTIEYYLNHFWKIKRIKRLIGTDEEKNRLLDLLKKNKIRKKELWQFAFNKSTGFRHRKRAILLCYKDLYTRLLTLKNKQ